MTRLVLLLIPCGLWACDPDSMGRPVTLPSGTDDITQPVVGIDPGAPGSGDVLSVVILVEAETAREGTVLYQPSWYRDGTLVEELSGADTVPAESISVAETWTLEVLAVLDDLQSEVASDEVTIGNSAPTVSVSLDPGMPSTEDDVEAVVVTDDPDGESSELAYAWYLDDYLTDLSDAVLPAEETTRDESWSLQVLATDPGGAVAEAWASVVVGNSAPSVLGASISPATISAADTLSCAALGFSDPDGDEAVNLYAWYVDGALLSEGEEPELASGMVRRGQWVHCEVTASDGSLAGNTVSSVEIEVVNTAPSAPVVGINPPHPVAGHHLMVYVVSPSVDLDGDVVSYTLVWTVDGDHYGEDVEVPGEDVLEGQVWEVTLTPTDGDLTGESSSASVTIGA